MELEIPSQTTRDSVKMVKVKKNKMLFTQVEGV